MEYHIPGNKETLKKLYAFVSEDKKGNHGIMAFIDGPMHIPLVTMEERNVPKMRILAKQAQANTGQKVRFATLTLEKMEDI